MCTMVEKSYIRNGQTHFPENGQMHFSGNGQPHFAVEQRNAIPPKCMRKNCDQTCFFILYTILLFVVCAGFVGFSYYLYARQNYEIQSFSDKICHLNSEVDRLRKKLDNLTSTKQNVSNNIQNMLQESDSSKFRAIAVENVEEYPDIEELDDENLISNDEYNNNEYTDEEIIDEAKNGKSVEDTNYNNYHPPVNISISSLSDHSKTKVQRRKRSAEILSSADNIVRNTGKSISTIDFSLPIADNITKQETFQAPDSLDNKNSNVSSISKQNDNAVLIKGDMITMPFTNFIEYFKNSQPNDHFKSFDSTSKKFENCSMTIKNSFYQNNLFRRTKYGSNSEEDGDDITDSAAFHSSRKSFIAQEHNPGPGIYTEKKNKVKSARRTEGNRNGKLASMWQKELDVEVMSEKDDDEAGQMKPRSPFPIVAAHFGGDTSKYNMKMHDHYKGNGRLRHVNGEHKDWQPSSWFQQLDMNQHFTLKDGNITVHRSGLYFVYAQIFYSDYFDVNGYAILQNTETVLQCITTSVSNEIKSNTCYTGAVINCHVGDILSIKTIQSNRHVILEASKSFFGMFKIGEMQTK